MMLQGGEIIIILLVALVVLGPERLPQLARKLGAWSTELRRAASELRAGLEAEVGDIKQLRDDIKGPIDEMRGEIKDVGRQVDQTSADVKRLGWVGPEPTSGPTAADALADLDEIEAAEDRSTTRPGASPRDEEQPDAEVDEPSTDERPGANEEGSP
jgi:sec-independent protein translocase protein TatB